MFTKLSDLNQRASKTNEKLFIFWNCFFVSDVSQKRRKFTTSLNKSQSNTLNWGRRCKIVLMESSTFFIPTVSSYLTHFSFFIRESFRKIWKVNYFLLCKRDIYYVACNKYAYILRFFNDSDRLFMCILLWIVIVCLARLFLEFFLNVILPYITCSEPLISQLKMEGEWRKIKIWFYMYFLSIRKNINKKCHKI